MNEETKEPTLGSTLPPAPEVPKTITIVWSCITGKPSVTFTGEWSRKDTRVTLNAILRARHLYYSSKRKQTPAVDAATPVTE